jgi:hypothetical protein
MSTPVGAKQRFSKHFLCPVCGGHNGLPSGRGIRCHGFLSDDDRFAHCSREELAPGLPEETGKTYAHALFGECRCGTWHGDRPILPVRNGRVASVPPATTAKPVPVTSDRLCPQGYREVRAHAYTDTAGNVLFENVRYEHLMETREEKGRPVKTFRVRTPTGRPGLYYPSLGDTPRVVFNKVALAADFDAELHWPEGEDHVIALGKLGLLATTTVGGAGQVSTYTVDELQWAARGRDVVLHGDNDAAGEAYAAHIAKVIAPVAKSIHVVRYTEFGPSGDVLDFLRAGGDPDTLAARVTNADLVHQSSSKFGQPHGAGADCDEQRPAITPYPRYIWPPALADYFAAVARVVDAPVDMVATFATPIIGAVIGNRRALLVKPGFVVRPIIWSAVIAETATGKSPSFEHALALVAPL